MHKYSQNDAYYQAHPKGKAEIATNHLIKEVTGSVDFQPLPCPPFLHQRP